MTDYSCPRCGAHVRVPVDLAPSTRAQLAAAVRAGPLPAVKKVQEVAALTLGEAKAYAFHVTRPGGQCHRCRHVFTAPGPGVCPNCRSFNLND